MYKAGEYMIWTDGTVKKCVQDTNFSPEEYPQAWEDAQRQVKRWKLERDRNGLIFMNNYRRETEMPDTVLVAVLSLVGTLAGSFGGTQLIKYRIEQLEKKVEKHNSVVERTYLLEEKVKVANHRIEDLERKVE